ncbi:uracil-DNA glycosylase [Agaribacterium sp. ZY112]|uniref:uracil-DNA glycosylase n=1 Tax=Agaribacterium sp. ZY112 TaxID=3233574 RepID=UPI003523FCDD
MTNRPVKLEQSWLNEIGQEFDLPYMQALRQFLQQEKAKGKNIYPSGSDIFNALNSTPFDRVKLVILGQDPYHGPGQAHGLSFSVPRGIATPPSLQNIFKEQQRSLNLAIPSHGCLQSWADQGVLLLNATLTVERANAGSHQRKGWEQFTDAVVAALNAKRNNVVYLLWGAYAQKKGRVIDAARNLVLKSPHPSPLSAHRGFIGNDHFVVANNYLQEKGLSPINWALPE